MNSRTRIYRLAVASLVTGILLAGCAAGGGAAKKQESLEDRALARWNYLINKEPDNAWQYLSPGTRAMTPKNQYTRETLVKPVQWTGVRYLRQDCADANTCKVFVVIDYKLRSHLSGVGMIGTSQTLEETWVKDSGTWYFLPSQ